MIQKPVRSQDIQSFCLADVWNDALKKDGYNGAYPTKSLEIEFTVSGLDAANQPADTTAPTTGDSTKPNTNTGVEGVAAVAGVALLATGAVVVAKQRESNLKKINE